MAWTPWIVRSTGELITAAFWNDIGTKLTLLKTSLDDDGHVIDPVWQFVSATYAIASTDDVIVCTANSFTVTLPTAVGRKGRSYRVKNTGTGTITMGTTSAQTIDGAAASTTTLAQNDCLDFESDNVNWIIV